MISIYRVHVLYDLTETFVYFWGWEYKYNVTLTKACNPRIVYMLYDDELYMLKSNKIYAMLCYVMLCYVMINRILHSLSFHSS